MILRWKIGAAQPIRGVKVHLSPGAVSSTDLTRELQEVQRQNAPTYHVYGTQRAGVEHQKELIQTLEHRYSQSC